MHCSAPYLQIITEKPTSGLDPLASSLYERCSIAEGTALRRCLLAIYAFDNITPREPSSVREARNRSLGWLVVLLPSDKNTACPYKGTASYYSVQAGGEMREAIVWYYPTPIPAAADIEGHLCFFNEKVDLEVDGEAQQRLQTQWS
jgi:hypothetical protein